MSARRVFNYNFDTVFEQSKNRTPLKIQIINDLTLEINIEYVEEINSFELKRCFTKF